MKEYELWIICPICKGVGYMKQGYGYEGEPTEGDLGAACPNCNDGQDVEIDSGKRHVYAGLLKK